jgi:hypothetical protein
LLEALAEKIDLYEAGIRGVFCGGTSMNAQYVRFITEELLENKIGFRADLRKHADGPGGASPVATEDNFSITYYAPQPRAALRVVNPIKLHKRCLMASGARGADHHDPRILHAAISRADEAVRREPCEQYPWDGVGEVRPFGAMQKTIVEGVY